MTGSARPESIPVAPGFQPHDLRTQHFKQSQFYQAADYQIAAWSWMLTFGIVHVEQGTQAPGDLLIRREMNERGKEAP